MTAIEKLLNIANAEIGYLEKRTNSQLDSKTANAGSNNFTKYWRDIKPDYQGQPWCAAFVTWCMEKAFGKENAKKLLKHYPYVYVPTIASLFERHANPKIGDIVCFYRNGTFTHTGFVTSVNGDCFTTVEGNTSNGSSIVANGGAVCKKGYYNSNLPGTKFVRPDYSIIESEDLTMTQYEELKNMIKDLTKTVEVFKQELDKTADRVTKLENPMIYNYLDDNIPDWALESIQKAIDKGILKGDENGLGLTMSDIRQIVREDRAGLYD